MKKIWELPTDKFLNQLSKLPPKEKYEAMRELVRSYKFDKQSEKLELKLVDLMEKYDGVDVISAFAPKILEMIGIYQEVYPDTDFSDATRLLGRRI